MSGFLLEVEGVWGTAQSPLCQIPYWEVGVQVQRWLDVLMAPVILFFLE